MRHHVAKHLFGFVTLDAKLLAFALAQADIVVPRLTDQLPPLGFAVQRKLAHQARRISAEAAGLGGLRTLRRHGLMRSFSVGSLWPEVLLRSTRRCDSG